MVTDVIWKQSFLWCQEGHFSWGNKGKRTSMIMEKPNTAHQNDRRHTQSPHFSAWDDNSKLPSQTCSNIQSPRDTAEQDLGLKMPRQTWHFWRLQEMRLHYSRSSAQTITSEQSHSNNEFENKQIKPNSLWTDKGGELKQLHRTRSVPRGTHVLGPGCEQAVAANAHGGKTKEYFNQHFHTLHISLKC